MQAHVVVVRIQLLYTIGNDAYGFPVSAATSPLQE